MDLYLSKSELAILNTATLIWGCLQWYDLVDKYIIKRFTKANRANSRRLPAGPDGSADAREGRRANTYGT